MQIHTFVLFEGLWSGAVGLLGNSGFTASHSFKAAYSEALAPLGDRRGTGLPGIGGWGRLFIGIFFAFYLLFIGEC